MCGIVTAIARRNIVPVLLEGLRKLEYRGYDSAGLAVLKTEGTPELTRLRAVGRVAELAAQADATQLSANIGIAHTRWATHGVPSERNAHPHISGGLAVVHNGIIENFEELRSKLQAKGYAFTSETDTEVVAHLVHDHMSGGADPAAAVMAAEGGIRRGLLDSTVLLGELSLDGRVRKVRGVLPAMLAAARAGFERAIVPAGQQAEAGLVPGLTVWGAGRLEEVAALVDAIDYTRDFFSGKAAGASGGRIRRRQARATEPSNAQLGADDDHDKGGA